MPPELQTTLRTLREAHPGWGPESLLATLRADPAWRTFHMPSRSRVAAFLKQAGLTRKYQRFADLPQPPPQATQAPHEEWPVDAQGVMKVDGMGKVSVIDVIDVAFPLQKTPTRATRCISATARLDCDTKLSTSPATTAS